MPGVIQALEIATSALHLYGLSIVVARAAAGNPFGAISITVVTCVCIVLLTGTIIGTEIAKWRVRQWVRKHELEEQQQRRRHLEDKSE